MTPDLQRIVLHVLPNISQSKGKPDIETWSINRMARKILFFKMRQGY